MASHGSGQGSARIVDFSRHDPILARVRFEAEEAIQREPDLGAFMFANVLNHDTLEAIVVHRVAVRLENRDLPSDLIRQIYMDVLSQDASIGEAFRADAMAVFDRDPACTRLIEPLLYFKGFQALQTYRLGHVLWKAGRRDLALYLQSRSSEVFQVDINPAALIGKGIFLDHATGIVIGSTVVIEDDVSMLQGVTLGGTGKEVGDRHPKIRRGVLLGAGAKVLGNIEVGHCSRVASGSVVLQAVPHNKTVAGVPARVVGEAGCAEPARSMDQIIAAKPIETTV
ncbi:MAG: serine O-acetyltransferase [Methylobacteriaceae bacterium]|jgi:serine O-acetyltransferase|nr:serine O-acetyltransferase [Methylobacteriaceae bacterium]